MRTKDLNKMKIIDCLIRHGSLPFNNPKGKEVSRTLKSCFGIRHDKDNRAYISEENGFGYKSLKRYLDEMGKEGIIIKENSKGTEWYSFNKQKFEVQNEQTEENWRKLLKEALECGDLETYYSILNEIDSDQFGLKTAELRNYEDCVRDNIQLLKGEKEILLYLLKAIRENRKIMFRYTNESRTVTPVAVLVSRDGNRTYLVGLRRKQLEVFRVDRIRKVQLLEDQSVAIDHTKYREDIKSWWDTDPNKKEVELLVRRGMEDSEICERDLREYFGDPCNEELDAVRFCGTIYGINGFMTYIREHFSCCILIKPETNKENLVAALQEKLARYEELIHG